MAVRQLMVNHSVPIWVTLVTTYGLKVCPVLYVYHRVWGRLSYRNATQ